VVRASEVLQLTGIRVEGDWLLASEVQARAAEALTSGLTVFHKEHPLAAGQDLADARAALAQTIGSENDSLIDEILGRIIAQGLISRDGSAIRLTSHSQAATEGNFAKLLEAVGTAPPSVAELLQGGFSKDEIDAAIASDLLVRVSPDFVMTSEFVSRAGRLIQKDAAQGITVSAFREKLDTSRKYALPLLEYFDRKGVTRREGNVRYSAKPGSKAGGKG
jgi:selenocysteine-specific elongation factor